MPTSYDEVAYDTRPRPSMHPDALATLAVLLGLRPAPVDRCRVLELGCGTGGNLLSLAEAMPGTEWVGIDLSARQIDTGRQVVIALGLKNLRLEVRSILEVDASMGTFDYILCHGVYSWVPENVRDKILAIVRDRLAPHGVAYVSYNTYPGWHMRSPLREMLRFHVGGIEDTGEKIEQAKLFTQFLATNVLHPEGVWGRIVKDEAGLVLGEGDYYLFHEHLEAENHPVYFYQFMEHAKRHDLQFLGEVGSHNNLSSFPAQVQETLRRICSDLLHVEQYLDFLVGRTFRSTLLVHANAPIDRAPEPDIIEHFRIVGRAKPVSANPDITTQAPEEFENDQDGTVTSSMPLVKAALVILYETWPRMYSFDKLFDAVCARLGDVANEWPADHSRTWLARSLVHLYQASLVGLHTHLPSFALEVGSHPRATPLARLQARTGAGITNRRHRQVDLPTFDREVLSRLDGTRDRATLVAELTDLVQGGNIELKRDGQPLTDPAQVRAAVAQEVEAALERILEGMLLVE
jgi:methyltransferase-like protein/SAM-dependent methyltransferase